MITNALATAQDPAGHIFSVPRFLPREPDLCTYCGFWASDQDHVVPQTLRGRLSGWTDRTVPACRQCNVMLGSVWAHTVSERRAIVKRKLRRRYKKLLKMPDWTQAELDCLGPELQRSIVEALESRDEVRRRIAYKSGRVFLIRRPPPVKVSTSPIHPGGRAPRPTCTYMLAPGRQCRSLAMLDDRRCCGFHTPTAIQARVDRAAANTARRKTWWEEWEARQARRAAILATRQPTTLCISLTTRGVACKSHIVIPEIFCAAHGPRGAAETYSARQKAALVGVTA